jgi:hypothetical protein
MMLEDHYNFFPLHWRGRRRQVNVASRRTVLSREECHEEKWDTDRVKECGGKWKGDDFAQHSREAVEEEPDRLLDVLRELMRLQREKERL